jgi:hypothetical protein
MSIFLSTNYANVQTLKLDVVNYFGEDNLKLLLLKFLHSFEEYKEGLSFFSLILIILNI